MNENKEYKIFSKAHYLIQMGWTQNTWARDYQDRPVKYPTDADACSYCLGGALWRATEAEDRTESQIRKLCTILAEVGGLDTKQPAKAIIAYNDEKDRRSKDVVKLLSKACKVTRNISERSRRQR